MAPEKKNNDRRGEKRGNTGRGRSGDDARRGRKSSNNKSRTTNDGGTQKATKDGFIREAEKIEVKHLRDDEGKTLASKLVNSSRGGGAQMNIRAPIPGSPGGLTVIADERNYSAFLSSAHQISAKTGTKSVAASMVPNDPRAYQRALLRYPHAEETRETLSVFGTVTDIKRRGKQPIEVDDEDMTDPADAAPIPMCMACGRQGHEIKNCVYPGHDGLVHGCMVCNKADHDTDSCVDFMGWPQRQQLEMLVQQRGNMPSMATELDWMERTKDFFAKNPFIHTFQSFPWTKEFGRKVAADRNVPRELAKYYYHGYNAEYLPKDPATKDLESFIKTVNANVALAEAAAPAPAPIAPKDEFDEVEEALVSIGAEYV